jgi:hypothetical protein
LSTASRGQGALALAIAALLLVPLAPLPLAGPAGSARAAAPIVVPPGAQVPDGAGGALVVDYLAPPAADGRAIRLPPPVLDVDDPGPPYGFPDENTFGWTTKGSDLDRWVWDTEGAIVFDVDLGNMARKGDIPAQKDYILEIYFGIVGWFWFDGDGVFDPVPAQNDVGVGDDPCPNDPMDLFKVSVNGQEIRTVQGEKTRPCDPGGAESGRVFDLIALGDDLPNWVRIPKSIVHEGKNTVKFEILDFVLGPPLSPYHSEYADGWEMYVDAAAIELAAPPLILSHGWTPSWDPDWVSFGDHWLPTLKANILNEMRAHFGQDPWRWAKDTQLGGGIWMNRYDRKQDFRISAQELLVTVNGFHSLVGFTGKGWMHGHSMGGLMSRWYLELLGGNAKIEKLAQTASPNTGSFAADGYTAWNWKKFEAQDEDYTATWFNLVPFVGPMVFTGWRDWWNRGTIGASEWQDGPGHGRDHLADFELKPVSRNPVLQTLNAAFPAAGVEYFTVRGDYGLWQGLFRWAVPGDGVVTLDSATLNGAISNFRTIDESHENVPARPEAARWIMRYYTGLDLDSGKPPGAPFAQGGGGLVGAAEVQAAEEPWAGAEANGAMVTIFPQDVATGPLEHAITVDTVPSAAFGAIVPVPEGPVNIALRAPDGTEYTPEDAGDVPWLAYADETNDAGARAYTFSVEAPAAGTWTLLVQPVDVPPVEGIDVYLTGMLDSPVHLAVKADQPRYRAGDTATLTAALTDAGAPLAGATVEARRPADGGDVVLTLLDDGAHGDGAAGDGVYGAAWALADDEGLQRFAIAATGAGSTGSFARSAQLEFAIAAVPDLAIGDADLAGSPAGAWGGELVQLSATVHSVGERAAREELGVTFFDGDPALGGSPLGRVASLESLDVGEARTLTLELPAPTHALELHALLDTADLELSAANNRAHAAMPFVPTPRTEAFVEGPAGLGGWLVGPATVALAPFDGSAPAYASTSYALDGGPELAYAGPFAVAADGDHLLQFRSVDALGRVEPLREVHVKIDTAAPTAALRNPQPHLLHVFDVAVANPAGFTGVAGLVDVAIAAADATAGVARVRVAVEGLPVGDAALGGDGLYHLTWDSTTASNGYHTLTYLVEDAAGWSAGGAQRVYVLASRTVQVDTNPNDTVARLRPGVD